MGPGGGSKISSLVLSSREDKATQRRVEKEIPRKADDYWELPIARCSPSYGMCTNVMDPHSPAHPPTPGSYYHQAHFSDVETESWRDWGIFPKLHI